jgi:hypothetical protein
MDGATLPRSVSANNANRSSDEIGSHPCACCVHMEGKMIMKSEKITKFMSGLSVGVIVTAMPWAFITKVMEAFSI